MVEEVADCAFCDRLDIVSFCFLSTDETLPPMTPHGDDGGGCSEKADTVEEGARRAKAIESKKSSEEFMAVCLVRRCCIVLLWSFYERKERCQEEGDDRWSSVICEGHTTQVRGDDGVADVHREIG